MPTIKEYLQYSEIAFASYAENLHLDQGNAPSYQLAKFTSSQAAKFDSSWRVLAQQEPARSRPPAGEDQPITASADVIGRPSDHDGKRPPLTVA